MGAKNILKPHLPANHPVKHDNAYKFKSFEKSIGRVMCFYGNFAVTLKALCYMYSLGANGLKEASETAVLNANYMKNKLEKYCKVANSGACMHEFVLSLEDIKNETGVKAIDIAKGMIDYGLHPPTMYFPLIVPEALMFEPTETESKETLDYACDVVINLIEMAKTDAQWLKDAPHTKSVGRPDEVTAARNPILRYKG